MWLLYVVAFIGGSIYASCDVCNPKVKPNRTVGATRIRIGGRKRYTGTYILNITISWNGMEPFLLFSYENLITCNNRVIKLIIMKIMNEKNSIFPQR